MSAFIVGKEHIDLIVNEAIGKRISWWDGKKMQKTDNDQGRRLGGLLIAENVESVCGRYEDAADMIPDFALTEYEAGPICANPEPKPVEVLKAISCYEYQSCEHDGWKESEAKVFCDALRRAVIAGMPGYENAPWEWTQKGSAILLSSLFTKGGQ